MNSNRPKAAMPIYKYGRLKTREEMIKDGTTKPGFSELIERAKELTKGVEFDLDMPLDPADD